MSLRVNIHILTKANSNELLLIQMNQTHINNEKNGYMLVPKTVPSTGESKFLKRNITLR